MDDDVIIKVENLHKKFCRSLKRSMAYGTVDLSRNFLGKPTYQGKLRKGEFWALENINFELKRGETLGIIGENGSGKSSLLRLISGIFPPDKGKITVKGRIGSLIAVGVGFHPHMTGRENIYLNGTILGMTRKEIDQKYDEIVEFAEIGEFLDAPVSTYSSGMRVRLGFSIAIHTEPEIMIVDEVLSVGDINFQRKSTNKLQEIKHKTSTIFVSHSLRHVSRISDRVILLNHGKVEKEGLPGEVISYYMNKSIAAQSQQSKGEKIYTIAPSLESVKCELFDTNNKKTNEIYQGEKFSMNIAVESKEDIKDVMLSVSLTTMDGSVATFINTENFPFDLKEGRNVLKCEIGTPRLLPNTYFLKVKMVYRTGPTIYEGDTEDFSVKYKEGQFQPYLGYYFENYEWSSQ